MEIKLKLDKRYKKDFKLLESNVKKGIIKGVRKAMFYAEAQSKKRFGTPGNLHVITGRLRASINSQVLEIKNDIIGRIKTNVEYAAQHELGLNGMPARPFLKPAIEENINKINQIISESAFRRV